MRDENCTTQDPDRRETERLSRARLQQLPLGGASALGYGDELIRRPDVNLCALVLAVEDVMDTHSIRPRGGRCNTRRE